MDQPEVSELRPKLLERFAIEFVNIYIEASPIHAAKWIKPKIRDGEIDRVRELITREFVSRGYSFPEKGQ